MREEQVVLGTAIMDPSVIEELMVLKPSDFTGTHRNLFTAILKLHEDKALSYGAVVDKLKDDGVLPLIGNEDVSGEAYLREIVQLADSRGIRAYIKKIEEAAIRHNVLELAALIATEVRNTDKGIQDVIDEAEKRIFNLRRRTVEDEGVTFRDLVSTYMPYLDGLRRGDIKPAWIPPLKAVRDLIQYVDRTEFVIVAGRPGEGKSSLLRYDALKTTIGDESRQPEPVVTFNLENDPFEYMKFAISTLTGINSAKLKSPENLTEVEYREVLRASETLAVIPWRVVTMPRPRVSDIDRIARKQVAEGAKLIQVDYVQLIENNLRSRVEDLSATTGALRGIALKTQVPVVAACQLSRSIEHRGDGAEPRLSDLRESGSIEQDATQVWFVRSIWGNPPSAEEVTDQRFNFPENFRNGYMVRDVLQAQPILVWVKKNRNGPIGNTAPIKWTMSTGRFDTLRGE